jgi:hypothetical protein
MPSSLGDRLSAARRRQFVGRATELALFQSALNAAELPFQVLFVYGPGGVGKTTLLNEFARLCAAAGARAHYLDARNIDPTPEAFLAALRAALDLPDDKSLLHTLAEQSHVHVFFIDTAELLLPIDNWLREVCLPQLPENTLVIMAGREPPAAAWRADAGWQTLIRVLPLRNLTPDESRAYLTKRSIPADQQSSILKFTHGFPLALSLVADVFAQRQDLRTFELEAQPDLIKILLERFVQKVPGPAHRAALEACALVRVTTEALLGEMLMMSDAVHELFDWLRGLSFVEARADGLFLHDLARDALAADLRWRNPDWYTELHRRARSYYHRHIESSTGIAQQRLLFDLIFLHRDNALVRPFLEWQASGSAAFETMRPADAPFLTRLIAQHEGAASARLAAHWFDRQPQAAQVLREAGGQPTGLLVVLSLHQVTEADRQIDPAVRAAWTCLQRKPLRAGETATLFRFWLARDTYQAVSPTQSVIFVNVVRHYLTTPGLAFTFFPCADPDFWLPMFTYADLIRLPEADFTVGGKTYGVYGHDWRSEPPAAWLGILAEREIAASPQTAPPAAAEAIIVLSETDFAAAARDALRDFTQPDLLAGNPLARSRLVIDRVGLSAEARQRVATLQAIVRSTAEALQSSPRDAKLYRAVYHTYLQPAPTQEQAAELLDVPFSTYRRHLKAGIQRLTEMLWQQELGN